MKMIVQEESSPSSSDENDMGRRPARSTASPHQHRSKESSGTRSRMSQSKKKHFPERRETSEEHSDHTSSPSPHQHRSKESSGTVSKKSQSKKKHVPERRETSEEHSDKR
ncbi:vitellogenin-A2-like [Hyla sarda]|uniref:vitellogenin-A2-like n=1 Tax=Hyla sarda TaxID=327740 RepID=UPI0024C3A8AE|nr:vitellogenin-A2-like [Hyla sarda]